MRYDVSTVSEFPASVGTNLEAGIEGESGRTWAFWESVGSLMWSVTMSRPDIANVVGAVAPPYHNTRTLNPNILKAGIIQSELNRIPLTLID